MSIELCATAGNSRRPADDDGYPHRRKSLEVADVLLRRLFATMNLRATSSPAYCLPAPLYSLCNPPLPQPPHPHHRRRRSLPLLPPPRSTSPISSFLFWPISARQRVRRRPQRGDPRRRPTFSHTLHRRLDDTGQLLAREDGASRRRAQGPGRAQAVPTRCREASHSQDEVPSVDGDGIAAL